MYPEPFGKEELSEVKADKASGASNENFFQESYPVLNQITDSNSGDNETMKVNV